MWCTSVTKKYSSTDILFFLSSFLHLVELEMYFQTIDVHRWTFPHSQWMKISKFWLDENPWRFNIKFEYFIWFVIAKIWWIKITQVKDCLNVNWLTFSLFTSQYKNRLKSPMFSYTVFDINLYISQLFNKFSSIESVNANTIIRQVILSKSQFARAAICFSTTSKSTWNCNDSWGSSSTN